MSNIDPAYEPRLSNGANRIGRAIWVGFSCWLLSLVLASPSLTVALSADRSPESSRFQVFSLQVADPFFRPEAPEKWDGGFLAWRILVPVIAKMLGFGPWGGLAMIWCSGLIALVMAFAFLAPRLGDRQAGLLTLALSMTPFTQASHVYLGYPDAVGHMLVMAMILWPSAIVWFISAFAGMFNDERILISLPIAVALVAYDFRSSLREVCRKVVPLLVASAAAVLVAWLLRSGIASGAVGGRPVEGLIYPRALAFGYYALPYYVAGGLLSFSLLWVLLLRAALVSLGPLERSAVPYWAAVGTYSLAAIVLSSLPSDFWRSLASIFPLALLAALIINEREPAFLRSWLPPLAIAMVLLPKLNQMGDSIHWIRPLPVAIYEYQAGESLLQSIRRQ